MSFKLTQSPKFKTTVEVWQLNEQGVAVKSTLKAIFKRFKTSEIEEHRNNGGTDRDLVRDKLVGWSDLLADDGTEVEFNDENKEILLEVPEAVSALALALARSASVQREKN